MEFKNNKMGLKIAAIVASIVLVSALIIFSLPAILGGRYLYPTSDYTETSKNLIHKAMQGLEGRCLVDTHIHIAGAGNSNSGIYINPKGKSIRHFGNWLKTKIYMSASAVDHEEEADQKYWARLQELAQDFKTHLPPQTSWYGVLLAFDKFYDESGNPQDEKTSLYVPNQYAHSLASARPHFSFSASIHPDRKDALEELDRWHAQGAKIVKWLPNSMRIDPTSISATRFLNRMKELDMILLTHVGEERAVDGEEFQRFGNPLLYRDALESGNKIIMAHIASLGHCADFENNNEQVTCFDLFWRLFQNPKYEANLFGEISAVTLHTRIGNPLFKIMESPQYKHRIVNGSDYPLPGVNWIFRTTQMVKMGLITEDERQGLNQIYRRNPLLFDFVVKRLVRHPENKSALQDESFSWPQLLGGCDFFKK